MIWEGAPYAGIIIRILGKVVLGSPFLLPLRHPPREAKT